jgi:phosphoenolpyruvate carboxylase
MRKIPSTMATQHPDNASRPTWNSRAFVSTSAELREAYYCFQELGMDEYNWDWEGKFVDEAVVDRLLHKYFEYFQKNPLGKEKFLTFRIPNPRVEKQFRLARAFMVMVTSSQFAQSLGFNDPPIFETILPLTETAEEILDIQEAFRTLVEIDHKLLKMKDSIQHIEIIPLFEQVERIFDSAEIISTYIDMHEKKFKERPEYLRPYCARSDPALNSGLVPTMLAVKCALSDFAQMEKEKGIKLYPMLGTGSLPFRGGVNPNSINTVLEKYAGASTLTIQSAFRYDYPEKKVKEAIKNLKENLQKTKAQKIEKKIKEIAKKEVAVFKKPYQETIEALAPLINSVSSHVARRRERVQHIGLFGYSRGVGKVSLPRAIPFTGSLYSIGIPPELVGTGRGLIESKKNGTLKDLMNLYPTLKEDMVEAGHFLNKKNLKSLSSIPGCEGLTKDVEGIEEVLQTELVPKTSQHLEHRELTDVIYHSSREGKKISDLITRAGILRKSLG